MYSPEENLSLANINNTDFTPFGVDTNISDQTSVDLDLDGKTIKKKKVNIPKKSATCVYWNLPELLCEHYNKFKGKDL